MTILPDIEELVKRARLKAELFTRFEQPSHAKAFSDLASALEAQAARVKKAIRDAEGWEVLYKTEKSASDCLDLENIKLNARISALEAQLAEITKERDDLREGIDELDAIYNILGTADAEGGEPAAHTIDCLLTERDTLQAQLAEFREAATWRSVKTAPHNVQVLLATPPFKCMGESSKWELKVGYYSWGERTSSYSTVSRDSYATLWVPLDALMAALRKTEVEDGLE